MDKDKNIQTFKTVCELGKNKKQMYSLFELVMSGTQKFDDMMWVFIVAFSCKVLKK